MSINFTWYQIALPVMNGGKTMDISKYLMNKEIQLSNDDINIEKLAIKIINILQIWQNLLNQVNITFYFGH